MTDNANVEAALPGLGYESMFRTFASRRTIGDVREAGSPTASCFGGQPAGTGGRVEQARFWNRTTVPNQADGSRVSSPHAGADWELRPLRAFCGTGWLARTCLTCRHGWLKEGFKLRILGFEVLEKKKRRRRYEQSAAETKKNLPGNGKNMKNCLMRMQSYIILFVSLRGSLCFDVRPILHALWQGN